MAREAFTSVPFISDNVFATLPIELKVAVIEQTSVHFQRTTVHNFCMFLFTLSRPLDQANYNTDHRKCETCSVIDIVI